MGVLQSDTQPSLPSSCALMSRANRPAARSSAAHVVSPGILPSLAYAHSVAAQVAFEKANFETRISLDRHKGLKPGAFKAMGRLDSTCTSPTTACSSRVAPSCASLTPPAPPPRSTTSCYLTLWKFETPGKSRFRVQVLEVRRFQAMGSTGFMKRVHALPRCPVPPTCGPPARCPVCRTPIRGSRCLASSSPAPPPPPRRLSHSASVHTT
jgi:hypothetical protein